MIRKENGRDWSRGNWWSGCWRTGWQCDWDCSCTSLCGIRRRKAFEEREEVTDAKIVVPENKLDEAGPHGSTIPVTYVPFRNAHFLSVGVSWAEVIGANFIYIGAVAEDSSGYPDCRPEYYKVFQELIRVGTRPETEIEIVTPVIAMKKNEIIRKGIELGAPLHLTWSCYQSEREACGVCDSCLLRLKAFAEAGTPDPIPYKREAMRKVAE